MHILSVSSALTFKTCISVTFNISINVGIIKVFKNYEELKAL